MGYRTSEITKRRYQIKKQLDNVARQLATRSPADYKAPHHYENSKHVWEQLTLELERELAILENPGEHEALPIAVVADQLGTSMYRIKGCIHGREIVAEGHRAHERISRRELERLTKLGVDELLRQSEESPVAIFELACRALREGDLTRAEWEYWRLDARETSIGPHAFAVEVALELLKQEYSEIDSHLCTLNESAPPRRAAMIACLAKALKGLLLVEDRAKAIAEKLIALSEGNTDSENLGGDSVREQDGETLDEMQQRAMFLTMVLLNAIEKARVWDLMKRETTMLAPLLRNALYTALHAEATYADSAGSRLLVDSTKLRFPRYYLPAQLMDL